MIRIASDIGGTFTDVVLECDGVLTTAKVLTTPLAPEQGLLHGLSLVLSQANIVPGQVDQLIHGTTLATNALIQRRGAQTAQIVTAGFRDVLEMAHENRFDQYDLSMDRAAPLIERRRRLEVAERVSADGKVLKALQPKDIGPLIDGLQADGVESVAITLLHSYANPEHEQAVAKAIRRAAPQMAVSLSSEVSPEIREYERFATTCANAYIQPLMGRYLSALSAELEHRGFGCPLLLVTSSGDLTDLGVAMAYPVRLVESGPAGGAVLAAGLARAAGLNEVLAFDMGGTTAKLCLIDGGKPQMTRSFEVGRVHHNMKGSGFPVRIPAIELVEIGSGGGSIARVDSLGRLLVGPQSAASSPGPVCYGAGGQDPTVTDADVSLGRIDATRFSADMTLDVNAAGQAILRVIGSALSLNLDLAAFAIAEIVDENMASAARVHAIESGKDLETRTMIAFGGAAPLHAARVARKLGVSTVVVPANAGVGSAIGFLDAGLAFEQARSLYMPLRSFDPDKINRVLEEMSAAARALLGGAETQLDESRTAYMRYRGQGHEITVKAPLGILNSATARALGAGFEARYTQLFGQTIPNLDLEILTWTVRVERNDHPPIRREPPPPSSRVQTGVLRSVFDAALNQRRDYQLLDRSSLPAGYKVQGPCLVVESHTTTVVPSDFDLEVAGDGALHLSFNAALRARS